MRLSRRRPLRTAMACVVSAFLVVASVAPVSAATPSPVTSGPFKLIGNFAIGPQGAYLCSTFAVEAVYIAGGGHVDDARWTLSGPGFLEDPQPSWFEHFVDQAAGTFVITATSGAYRASATIVVHLRPDPLPGPKPVCSPLPTPTPAGCDLKGVVRDGDLASDGHDNPLVGIPVELLQNGNPVGEPMVTGSDGAYCLPNGTATPGDYQLRASLVDGEHSPPVFETRHIDQADPVSATKDVTADDFGRQDLDFDFSATVDQPWLADVANIHWQSERFVTWLLDVLVLDPTKLAGLVINTGTTEGTQYVASTKTVSIQASDTVYVQRRDAASECPENCEWHEIGHHVANALRIAPFAAPACVGRVNHGGWTNNSTCDSLAEGFPNFLATLASLHIDAGRGAGYADARYSFFGSLEDNGYRPWSEVKGTYREDFAVAQLLWDLADATPAETFSAGYKDPAIQGGSNPTTLHDRVALGGTHLVQLLAIDQPATVADIYNDLLADKAVPAALKTADLDVNGDRVPDLSPLGEVFVMHGFYPQHLMNYDSYYLGDPVGLTQPGANNVAVRRHIEPIPGSAIRLQNPSTAEVTISIDVTYPSTSSHLEIVLPAKGERIVHLELPPYWGGILPAGQALPACAAPDPWPATVMISTPGTPSRTLSSCEFLQAVAATTTDSALTYTVSGNASNTTPVGANAGALGIGLLMALAVAVVVAAGIGFVILKRRRPNAS